MDVKQPSLQQLNRYASPLVHHEFNSQPLLSKGGYCPASFINRERNIAPTAQWLSHRIIGLVCTGFASQYRLQQSGFFKRPMGRRKATTPSSFSLTFNRVTANY